MADYPINKGIGHSVEFKGLKAQYLFIFAGGLLAVFFLVVVLYMAGADQLVCIGLGLTLGSLLVSSPCRPTPSRRRGSRPLTATARWTVSGWERWSISTCSTAPSATSTS